MARDFSPITFFHRTPNALLGRYFQEKHGILNEIVFGELEENGRTAEAILQTFSALSEPQQAKVEAEYQDIESMAHQAGVTALIDEATDFHKNANFPEAINQQDSFQGTSPQPVDPAICKHRLICSVREPGNGGKVPSG